MLLHQFDFFLVFFKLLFRIFLLNFVSIVALDVDQKFLAVPRLSLINIIFIILDLMSSTDDGTRQLLHAIILHFNFDLARLSFGRANSTGPQIRISLRLEGIFWRHRLFRILLNNRDLVSLILLDGLFDIFKVITFLCLYFVNSKRRLSVHELGAES